MPLFIATCPPNSLFFKKERLCSYHFGLSCPAQEEWALLWPFLARVGATACQENSGNVLYLDPRGSCKDSLVDVFTTLGGHVEHSAVRKLLLRRGLGRDAGSRTP